MHPQAWMYFQQSSEIQQALKHLLELPEKGKKIIESSLSLSILSLSLTWTISLWPKYILISSRKFKFLQNTNDKSCPTHRIQIYYPYNIARFHMKFLYIISPTTINKRNLHKNFETETRDSSCFMLKNYKNKP